MQLLNKKIAEMYGKLGIEAAKRIKHLTFNDVASSAEEYPVLTHIKGNKIRRFAPVALELSNLYADDRAGQHRVAENLHTAGQELERVVSRMWYCLPMMPLKKVCIDILWCRSTTN